MSDTSYRDFLNHTLNLSPEDKVSIARSALKKIIDYLEKLDATSEDITKLITNFTRLFVSSDVKTTRDEYSFFRAVTGADVTTEQFYELTNRGADPDFIDATLEFIAKFPSEIIEAFLTYGMMVMACDDNINYQESDLIQRILALL